jgi:hypothetical protein
MQKIRILTAEFEGEILGHEIPAFRGAIIDKIGRGHDLFHNHDTEPGSDRFLYRYPAIQYKRIRGNPAIVCVEEGVEDIHLLFSKKDWGIFIGDKKVELKLKNLNLQQFTLNVWNKRFGYHIYNWVGLNQKNYSQYIGLKEESEKKSFLSRILIGNILSFAKGMEWEVSQPIELLIISPIESKTTHLKGNKVLCFSFDFETNVSLPMNIGLGKSSSLGFGTIRKSRIKNSDVSLNESES